MSRPGSIARLAVFVSVSLAGPASAQSRGFEPSDLYRMQSVGDVQISPDGTHVLYNVIYRDRAERPYSRAWLWDVKSGTTSQLGERSFSSPRWSPDGQWIAFFGSEAEKPGLTVMRVEGRQAFFLAPAAWTNHPLPSIGESLAWSPDGHAIAFVSAAAGPEGDAADADPAVISRYLYKPTASEGITRFNDNRRVHIFIADLRTKRVLQLTDGDYYEHSIDWSPNGEELLFVSNREPDPDRFFNYDIFAVSVADGTIRRLTRSKSAEYEPRWSPDGKAIAFQGTERDLTSSETTMEDTHIWLMDRDGGNRREIGAAIDNQQEPLGWSADGKSVVFAVRERGNTRLYRLPVSESGTEADPELIHNQAGGVVSWSVSREGTLAYAASTPGDLSQLYLRRGSNAERLTGLNDPLLAERRVAEVEPFIFEGSDRIEVEAFLTHPLDRAPGSKHPLIVKIHGGPHSQDGPSFDFTAQTYASRGWATLKVNYRGSIGYGQAFADAVFGDQNGSEAKDVLEGVSAALRRYPWIDPERLGIEGTSYGGQLTNWIVTQTDRFKAAIPIAGISNLVSFNYMAYYHDYLRVEFGSYPHEDGLMDRLWEISPLRHVARVTTPTMLVHGENDNDVPIAEAEQFYIALKDVGVETIMVRYPREGHGIQETGHAVDLIERSTAWYEKHFSSPESAPAEASTK
ncbi:MAG: S9 family peptidase [Vicinamibacteria bacterium]